MVLSQWMECSSWLVWFKLNCCEMWWWWLEDEKQGEGSRLDWQWVISSFFWSISQSSHFSSDEAANNRSIVSTLHSKSNPFTSKNTDNSTVRFVYILPDPDCVEPFWISPFKDGWYGFLYIVVCFHTCVKQSLNNPDKLLSLSQRELLSEDIHRLCYPTGKSGSLDPPHSENTHVLKSTEILLNSSE